MDRNLLFLVACLVTLHFAREIHSLVEFKNIKCESVDKEFSDFEYCLLKSVNRTYKYLSLKVNLFKIPITKFKVNFALNKRFNGYKPFLYNLTFDGCKFMKNPKSNPIANYVYGMFKDVSNINHSCPYDHDLIVDKLLTQSANHHLTNTLPFPEGDYMFSSSWLAYDINRAIVKVYFTLS